MKGISTILAMILIVIIVVALIGLTYTFAVGLFGTTTTATTETTEAVTERMQKSIVISAANCQNTSDTDVMINFTIKHTGNVQIEDGDLAAILDGSDISTSTEQSGGTDIDASSLAVGGILSFGYYSASGQTNDKRTLTISAPAADVKWEFDDCVRTT